jgi:hypothetical protein
MQMIHLIAVKVDYRKTQFVISPRQLTLFQTKGRKHFRCQPSSNVRVTGLGKERFEIDLLLGVVVESQTDAAVAGLFGGNDVDGGRYHFSLRVMVSGLMDLQGHAHWRRT